MDTISYRFDGPVAVITIHRPAARNAVDGPTARALYETFKRFDADEHASVAVLTGEGEHFCAGADLKGVASGAGNPVERTGDLGPMGPTRLQLSKPVIAAVEGYAVAGGIELACWCDLRVAAKSATFGVFCRRFGVPLIDLGSVRLPRLIGASRAMDLILTGRPVGAEEALAMGLANRLVPDGQALTAAVELARQIAAFPQTCLRNDRKSALEQWSLTWDEAVARETDLGIDTLRSGEAAQGAARFTGGEGRGGAFPK
ncbi:MAG TPA: crotonase/enoyl-CoA hydratase family protein [Caulobacteraceae bacterium]